jgi:putative FmdB family regulatory protein
MAMWPREALPESSNIGALMGRARPRTLGARSKPAAIIAGLMPIYEYRCRNGHEFEVFQGMSEDPVSRCGECDAPVERVFHPVAVHFKGSGFYTTDYARAKSKAASDGTSGDAEGKKEKGDKEGGKEAKGSGEKAKATSGGD